MLQITIRAARVNALMSRSEAAKHLGISAEVLRNYESGRTAIPAIMLKKASQVYGIPEENIRPEIVEDGEFDEDEKNLNYTTV